jgi:hypothetical protein
MNNIETRRSDLLRQLFAVGNTLGMPTEDAQRERNARMVELQSQIDALPAVVPQRTGIEAGSIHIGGLLGDAPKLPPIEDETHADMADPYLRFMHEINENWR